MKPVLLVTGPDRRRRYRFIEAPLVSRGVEVRVVEDDGEGMRASPRLAKILSGEDWGAVIILGGDIRLGLRVAQARKATHAPVILRFGGDPIATRRSRSRQFLLRGRLDLALRARWGAIRARKVMQSVDGLLAVSGTLAAALEGTAGHSVPTAVSRPCVPIDEASFGSAEGKDDPVSVVSVMNLGYREKADGIGTLVEIMRRASEQADRDLDFHVLGGGIHANAVRRRWEGRHGRLNVSCHGHRDDVPSFLGRAGIFAYCSTLDSYPLSILEAQIAGLPVFVNDQPFTREFIEDGVDGVMFDEGKLAPAVNAFTRLLESGEFRSEVAIRGRESARRRNDPDRIGSELVEFLESVSREGDPS